MVAHNLNLVAAACSSSPDVAMEDAHSPVPAGTADAAGQRGAPAERRSVSLPVSELSPPPGELGEDSFVCHICLASADCLTRCRALGT